MDVMNLFSSPPGVVLGIYIGTVTMSMAEVGPECGRNAFALRGVTILWYSIQPAS